PLELSGMRPVHLSAKVGSIKLLRLLLKEGADITALDNTGKNVLQYALNMQDPKVVGFLIDLCPHLITPQAIAEAASLVSENILEQLLAKGPNQNQLDVALVVAMKNRSTAAFLRLYEKGAQLSSPLIEASATGQSDILDVILKDPNTKEFFTDASQTIQIAAHKGYMHCVYLLLEAGFTATLCQFEQEPTSSIHTLLTDREAYRKQVKEIEDLFQKIDNEQYLNQVVAILKTWPPNEYLQIIYNGKAIWGTPLQLLLRVGSKLGSSMDGALATLLQHPQLDPHLLDCNGNTLAHLYLMAGRMPPSGLQVEWNAVNHDKQTVVHTAVVHSSLEILQALLEKLKSLDLLSIINVQDPHGLSPLFLAVREDDEEKAKLLVEFGADINAYNAWLLTPLAFAAMHPGFSLAMMRLLLTHGADPNLPITRNRQSVVSLLLEKEPAYFRAWLEHGGKAYKARLFNGFLLTHEMKQSFYNLLQAAECSYDSVTPTGLLPIHTAAASGNISGMQHIISLRNDMLTATVEAIGEVKKGQEMLLQGATPLHMAARNNQLAAVDFLLKRKADLSAKTVQGEDVYSFAAGHASKTMMDRFLPYKIASDPNTISIA
ncbi:MAG: ankyrin repeat domain-containing protein, partial [Verrucomicrobia bacterium]|nr:ankyrin repeat domain-containing protein [Verrucomicrobiota bacterium]